MRVSGSRVFGALSVLTLASCKVGSSSDAKQLASQDKTLVIYLDNIDPAKNFEDGAETWGAEIYLSQVGQSSNEKFLTKVGPYKTSDFSKGKTFIALSQLQIDELRKSDEIPYQLKIQWKELDSIRNDDAGVYTLYLGAKGEKSLFTVATLPKNGSGVSEMQGNPLTKDSKVESSGTDINMRAHWLVPQLDVSIIATQRTTILSKSTTP